MNSGLKKILCICYLKLVNHKKTKNINNLK